MFSPRVTPSTSDDPPYCWCSPLMCATAQTPLYTIPSICKKEWNWLKEAQQFYWQLTIYETVPQREVTLNVGKYIVIHPRSKYPDVSNVPRKITWKFRFSMSSSIFSKQILLQNSLPWVSMRWKLLLRRPVRYMSR
jgi:hypothetical protein